MEQRGKELEDGNTEQKVREKRTEDGNKGDGRQKVDKGQSDKCCLWNKEHRIDAKASQSLKVIKIKEQRKDKNGI